MIKSTSHPPRFTEMQVKAFVDNSYGLETSVTLLVSDIGQNFKVQNVDGQPYIFKIANQSESIEILEAQNDVLLYLSDQNFEGIVPQVIPNKANKLIETISSGNGTNYNCRLLSYLEGTFLAEFDDQNKDLLEEIGLMMGRMDTALKDFSHPAIHRYWHWDLKNIPDMKAYTEYISDTEIKRVVEYFLLQFETLVIPQIIRLPKSLIHNDANDHNILISAKSRENLDTCALIDFGDMVYTCTIFEIAIALSYIMFRKDDPLLAAVPVIEGYTKASPLNANEISILFYCIAARSCQSVIMAAYQRHLQPDNAYLSVSEKDAQRLLIQFLEINPERAEKVFRRACGFSTPEKSGPNRQNILRDRSKIIGKSLSISYQTPLKIIKGAMQYLYEENGRTYLDCVNNVCHVGHCHPKVVQAAQKQMALLNTNTRYLHEYLVEYAEQLTRTLPDPLNVCYFVNSGSEANELALRLAFNYTNTKEVIVLDHAYHGNTSLLIDISPYKYQGRGGKGPGVRTHKVMMPDLFRGPFKQDEENAGFQYAKTVSDVIQGLQAQNKTPPVFISESLPGCGGQILLPDGYLESVYGDIRSAGGVCIADEVQVGFGRVGKRFWGFELQNVIPDIVTMGKPMGNGHPIGAVVTTAEIADAFNNGMEYFNTFGGNPVSSAVGMAVLDVINKERLQEQAENAGNSLMVGLREIQKKNEIIGDVRGSGLFIGIELVKDPVTLEPATEEASRIVNKMKEEGILLSTDGPYENVIKIKPPLVFNNQNADRVISTLKKIL